MARKVYLSVLGTNHYLEARYYFNEKKGNEKITRFVQQATMTKECVNWSENDAAYIFVTDDALGKNWINPAQKRHRNGEYTGLSKIIEDMNFKFKTEAVSIPEGFTQEEIWRIFEIVFDKLKEGDELYFDITHSFRSLPMLVMVLINYAKFLKNITVARIYYGAFEELGPAFKVKDIPAEERFAPVLDITSFSTLQDWTNAANNFIRFRNPETLIEITQKKINPVLKETKGQDLNASHLREFSKKLKKFTDIFVTNRGEEIYRGYIAKDLKNVLQEVKNDDFIAPLTPLIDKIEHEIEKLDETNSVINGFRAVKWCLDANLIQQAYSLLRESIISYLLYSLFRDDFNYMMSDPDKRELVSSALKIRQEEIPEKQWHEKAVENKEFIMKIVNSEINPALLKHYAGLGEYRNDIMHAGFRPNKKSAKKIIDKINESFDSIQQDLNIKL